MSTLEHLADKGLVRPPRWLPRNVMYETIMGSVAYGVSGDTSDMDVYGFAIPPKDEVFPHLRGEVAGFGTPRPRFEQFEAHHVADPDALGGSGRSHHRCFHASCVRHEAPRTQMGREGAEGRGGRVHRRRHHHEVGVLHAFRLRRADFARAVPAQGLARGLGAGPGAELGGQPATVRGQQHRTADESGADHGDSLEMGHLRD